MYVFLSGSAQFQTNVPNHSAGNAVRQCLHDGPGRARAFQEKMKDDVKINRARAVQKRNCPLNCAKLTNGVQTRPVVIKPISVSPTHPWGINFCQSKIVLLLSSGTGTEIVSCGFDVIHLNWFFVATQL